MNGKALIELFNKAAGALQYPRVTVITKEGKVVVYRQGERSKNKRGLAITDGGAYGESTYYGCITAAGIVQLRNINLVPQYVLDVINDPVGEAIKSARLTGNCCFCSTPLKNKSSLYHGYGPICAEKWGLPWGDVPKTTLVDTGKSGADLIDDSTEGI